MATYTVEISFKTDRTLTETELDTLLTNLVVQIEEPADEVGNDTEFTTSNITIDSNFIACQLCGNALETNTGNRFLEPFGSVCVACFDDVKEFGTSRILTDKENN